MSHSDESPDLATVANEIRDRVRRSPFHRGLGMRIDRVDEGSVTISMDAGEQHGNLAGQVHGGVLATLADTAAGLAVKTVIPAGSGHVTATLDVQYLRAASPGPLRAEGRVIRAGRRLAFVASDVLGPDGEALARAQLTVAITPTISEPSDR
jgi:uncharacterized protein (TIGR00369 family)